MPALCYFTIFSELFEVFWTNLLKSVTGTFILEIIHSHVQILLRLHLEYTEMPESQVSQYICPYIFCHFGSSIKQDLKGLNMFAWTKKSQIHHMNKENRDLGGTHIKPGKATKMWISSKYNTSLSLLMEC